MAKATKLLARISSGGRWLYLASGICWWIASSQASANSSRRLSRRAINFKVAKIGRRTINVAPEYEDCKRAALKNGVPLKQVMEDARARGFSDLTVDSC